MLSNQLDTPKHMMYTRVLYDGAAVITADKRPRVYLDFRVKLSFVSP